MNNIERAIEIHRTCHEITVAFRAGIWRNAKAHRTTPIRDIKGMADRIQIMQALRSITEKKCKPAELPAGWHHMTEELDAAAADCEAMLARAKGLPSGGN